MARPKPPFLNVDFDRSPFIVIWEATRACDLKCVHCRAEAIAHRDAGELSTAEAYALMEDSRRFMAGDDARFDGSGDPAPDRPGPLFVITGGDPMWRPDIMDIIEHGNRIGLRMTMTPSGTQRMTLDGVRECKRRGLSRMAVSLDGSTPEIHDAFRKVDGSYRWTLDILEWCREERLSTQINTTITTHNIEDIDNLCELMTRLGITMWSVFFLVPTGRGSADFEATAEQYEHVFEKMYAIEQRGLFDVKSTAAQHYRRYVLQQKRREKREAESTAGRATSARASGAPGLGFSLSDGVGRAKTVNDGNGFVFISHTGDVYPSGFLPLSGGNVRRRSLMEIYRRAPLFLSLRDYTGLKGKCGHCEYKNVCGGSRARAYGMMGDVLESDPFCAYVPPKYQRLVDNGEAQPDREYFGKRIRAHLGRAIAIHSPGDGYATPALHGDPPPNPVADGP